MGISRGPIILPVLMFGIVFAMAAQVEQPQRAPYTISISTPQTTIKAGLAVRLDITIENISDQVLYLVSSTAPGRNMKIEVRDLAGKLVPETANGLKVQGRDPKRAPFVGSVFSSRIPIEPGARFTETISLDKEYDLSHPDTYTIRIHRSDVVGHGSENEAKFNEIGMVKSNIITMTVTP